MSDNAKILYNIFRNHAMTLDPRWRASNTFEQMTQESRACWEAVAAVIDQDWQVELTSQMVSRNAEIKKLEEKLAQLKRENIILRANYERAAVFNRPRKTMVGGSVESIHWRHMTHIDRDAVLAAAQPYEWEHGLSPETKEEELALHGVMEFSPNWDRRLAHSMRQWNGFNHYLEDCVLPPVDFV